jgi:hypothetical protein
MATSIKLDPKLKARVDDIAQAQRRSAHWIMIEAIRQYVEREERGHKTEGPQPWASFHDRAQDEIAPAAAKLTDDELPPLRHWSEVLIFEPNPDPDPEREAAWKRFEALKGAGAELGGGRTKEEIDAHIRWLRDDRS